MKERGDTKGGTGLRERDGTAITTREGKCLLTFTGLRREKSHHLHSSEENF